jgi:hypothetical protein
MLLFLVVCRPLPPDRLIPIVPSIFTPAGMLCVSASIGQSRTQTNILSKSIMQRKKTKADIVTTTGMK